MNIFETLDQKLKMATDNMLESVAKEILNEIAMKKAVRGGKIVKIAAKKKKGFKMVGGKMKKMGMKEKRARMLASKKAWKKGKAARMKKTARSMKKTRRVMKRIKR